MEIKTAIGLLCIALIFMNVYKSLNVKGMKGMFFLYIADFILGYISAQMLL